jgi:D-2-hydroxyacid dehydrogenase (NADP+)
MTAGDDCMLIVDPLAERYAELVSAVAPEAAVVWSATFSDAEPHLADARAVITMGIPALDLHLTREVVDKMPKLEWVQCLLAGHEHLSGALGARPDILLTTVRGVHGPQMAETVLLHMLVLARRVKQQVANQQAHRWEPWHQQLLEGRAVAVVGLGESGRRIALTCHGLGMTVYGVSRAGGEVAGVERVFERAQLKEVAAIVDFLVLAVPGGSETKHMVDASVLHAMAHSAVLINVSRGSVVDEQALIAALKADSIAGAGLDVFEAEPLASDSELWDLENVFVTPHIGGRSDRYTEQAFAVVGPNVRAFLDGRVSEMLNVVAR